jgi:hypothetical protein
MEINVRKPLWPPQRTFASSAVSPLNGLDTGDESKSCRIDSEVSRDDNAL